MAESAALLVDEVLPGQPMRQWVLSFPYQLRFLVASRPEIMGQVLGIVYRMIATHLIKKAGLTIKTAHAIAAGVRCAGCRKWSRLSKVEGELSAGFRVHRRVAERGNSSQKLLDVGEKGVYSSYTQRIDFFKPVPMFTKIIILHLFYS